MSLTDIAIRNLKAETGQRLEVWDDKVPGLGVRISATGTKSFVLLYRHEGRAQRLTLGRFPVISLKEARMLAQDALHKITHGFSPKPQPEAVVATEEIPLFKQTAADFLQLHCYRKNRKKTATEIERLLQTHFLPKWAARDVRDITKHETLKIIDGLVASGRPSTANHAFASIRRFFNWCVERGIITISPCMSVGMPSPINKRARVLKNSELAAVWKAAVALGYPYGSIVLLLILTGQRRNEVSGMKWSEFDADAGFWSMAAERTKNGHAHQIPLLPMAADILAGLPRHNPTFLFPARGNSDASFSGFSKLKSRLDDASGVDNWTLHDLRRTTATGLASLGIALHVVEKLLNHVSGSFGGVAGIYNRFQYAPEMRDALTKWEAHLQALIVTHRQT